jgi:hypothetical protein
VTAFVDLVKGSVRLTALATREPGLVALLVTGPMGGRHNEVEHLPGVGHRGGVAGGNLTGRGPHPPGHEPLGIRIDRSIMFGDQVPGGNPFPEGEP